MEFIKWSEIDKQIDGAQDLKTIVQMREQMDAFKIFAKQIDGSLRTQNRCGKYKFYLEQKAGEIYENLDDGKGEMAGRGRDRSLTDLTTKQQAEKETDKSRVTLNRWVKESGIDKEKIEKYEAVCNEEGTEFTSKGMVGYDKTGNSVHFLSESSEWCTPEKIIKKTIQLFSLIDLDPCSDSDRNVPASNHFMLEDNGLEKKWFGKVYMNPPYGREIEKWVRKLKQEYSLGNIKEAIALVPARTDTSWFYIFRDYPICFIKGRLRFSNQENSAPFPSMLVYLGKRINDFQTHFENLGDIWQRRYNER